MTQVTVVAAIITVLTLGAGGALTTIGPWYRSLRKPWWNPPNWLFGPAWTVIGGLTAWAGVLAWTAAPDAAAHWRIALLFAVNVALNVLWSPLFFKFERPDWSLAEVPLLWLSVLALIVVIAPYSTLAAWLLAPYLIWVAFAAFLNLTIVRLNAPFGVKKASDATPAAPAPAFVRASEGSENFLDPVKVGFYR